jgi:thiol:disulfide interchange protein
MLRKASIFKFTLLFISIFLINSAISKNNDLLNSKKLSQKRSEFVEDLDLLKKRIFENEENAILVFYADWCPHW